MRKYKRLIFHAAILLIALFIYIPLAACQLPENFVYIKDVIPDITVELRYYTENNFVGQRIDGYIKPRCIMTKQAAWALKKVHDDLKAFGLGLKIFDAYRPHRAVDHFIRWAKDLKNTKMKSMYYPAVSKKNLFKEGYIAARSSHTRGSAVDVTIITLDSKEELDMGSGFDFFGSESWTNYPNITATQRAHRLLLQVLMMKHGFEPINEEWWHFKLRDEPFPDQYFDFPIQ